MPDPIDEKLPDAPGAAAPMMTAGPSRGSVVTTPLRVWSGLLRAGADVADGLARRIDRRG